ncbi:MAG TPA: lipoyl synthase [Terriglobales bacterium]|nr:lipoyl synthase [Terriglobales bacterium]
MPTLTPPPLPDLVQIAPAGAARAPRPEWLRVRVPGGENFHRLQQMARQLELHTVCESARCPNIGECWNQGTATFMILGDLCTRRCGFCAVPKGRPLPIDQDEPRRVGEAVARLRLRHAVITSVNRDDDNLGGARIFAATIQAVRERVPECSVEVLIPDFRGSAEALQIVLAARPHLLNHNTETVPSLYRFVRPGAKFERSLELLRNVKRFAPGMVSKTGLMLGLGEGQAELLAAMAALAATGCDILTLGQYLQPSRDHLPVKRLYTPAEFAELKRAGEAMGFGHVEAGPLVRSSYHAGDQASTVVARAFAG